MAQNSFAADPKLIRALEKRSPPISCIKDRFLFHQGDNPDGLFILQSGEAALVMHATSGDLVMCLSASAGSLLGLPAVISNEPYTMTALVRKGSEVGFVSREDFGNLLSAEPLLYHKVLQVLASEVRIARLTLIEI
jgi:CRP-like cAMP-binding protein